MCRLLAVRAPSPVPLHHVLAAFERLSVEHKDGWGLARLDASPPQIEHGLEAAYGSGRFAALRSSVVSAHLLAHLRLASVGAVTSANAHPFLAGGWTFMHNGTVQRFDERCACLEAAIAPRWRSILRGQTDSERCFGLFLTSLEARVGSSAPEACALEDVAASLAAVMRRVSALCDDAAAGLLSALNFVVSDGRRLVASRRGRPLFHGVDAAGTQLISSEPLHEGPAWSELPEDSLIGLEESLTVRRWTCEALCP